MNPNIEATPKISWKAGKRVEKDLLGEKEVPADAYFGIQTLRAVENYNITGVMGRAFPEFIVAFAQVKKACAMANHELGLLSDELTYTICGACDELLDPKEGNKGGEVR